MAGELYQAKSTFAAPVNGVPTVIVKGELVRAGHPIIKGHEDKFELAKPRAQFEVEQATKAPGEKRGARAAKEA